VHVLGAGGHAKVVIATLRAAGRRVVAVWDDDPAREGTTLLGVPIRGPVAGCPRDPEVVLAIGANDVRARLAAELPNPFATVVHPSVPVDEETRIGPGTVVLAGAVVQVGAVVGAHVIVNIQASVSHDTRIGDFAHLSAGVHLGGGAQVRTGAFLGLGVVVKPGLVVGAWATVGAGSVVIRPVEEGTTVVGCPARPIHERTPVGA
jgi:sugar O-acyltransferase (sialic acid O-acetyltransferase NeuD family)